jgi:transcription antitermination factor NusG
MKNIDDIYNIVNWYALYTKPRHEKFVEELLLKRGVEAYTPKVTMRRRWSDRIKLVDEPLFKGYCFAKFPLIKKKNIVSQPGVVDIIHFNEKYPEINETVIDSLKIISENDLKVDPCPYLKKGDRITIRRGPYKGFEGYIIEKRNKNATLVVSVDAIAASIKCIIDADFVDHVYM